MRNSEPISAAARVAAWRKRHPERYKAQQKAHRDRKKAESPEKLAAFYRERNYRSKYGITTAQYNEMLIQQGGVCALCGGNNGKKYLAVDHCHNSKKVRQLLCNYCNLTISHIENAKAPLEAYINYIQKYKNIHGE